jgi:hypothetical protein
MNHRGQSLIEVVFFFFGLVFLLAGMTAFTQWFNVRQRLLIAAWEGAQLYSSGHFTKGEVESRVKRFLARGSPALDENQVQVSFNRPSWSDQWYGIDHVTVSFSTKRGWYHLLGAYPTIKETITVKHAPYYWAPFQPWGGPAIS